MNTVSKLTRRDGPSATSLTFALMAATTHADNGDWQAFVTAMCDALWVSHTGRHEQVADRDMVAALRGIAGHDWEPPA